MLSLSYACELAGCYYCSHFILFIYLINLILFIYLFYFGKLRLRGDLVKVTQQVVDGRSRARDSPVSLMIFSAICILHCKAHSLCICVHALSVCVLRGEITDLLYSDRWKGAVRRSQKETEYFLYFNGLHLFTAQWYPAVRFSDDADSSVFKKEIDVLATAF